jgi:hypothetical protein
MLARIASMKLFRCQVCDNIIYFENRTCGRCGHRLGYLPELEIMAALEPAGGESWTPLVGESGPRRFCANADYDVCNWLAAAEGQDRLLCGLPPQRYDSRHFSSLASDCLARH